MWIRSVKKFLRSQATVKYVIYVTTEAEELLKIDRCPWKNNTDNRLCSRTRISLL